MTCPLIPGMTIAPKVRVVATFGPTRWPTTTYSPQLSGQVYDHASDVSTHLLSQLSKNQLLPPFSLPPATVGRGGSEAVISVECGTLPGRKAHFGRQQK